MHVRSSFSRLLVLSLLVLSHSKMNAGTVEVFFNFDIFPGGNLIGHPLYRGGNLVGEIFPTIPPGTQLLKFANNGFVTNRSDGVEWEDPWQSLVPGEGAFLISPLDQAFTLAIAGQIRPGRTTNAIPDGLFLVSPMTIRAGAASTELGLSLGPFDNLYLWRTNRFEVFTFLPNGKWSPTEPIIARAEAFFVRAHRPLEWIVEGEP